ncbi:MAG: hypothetical protein M0005_12465 [Actinomycetota bacterium]|nr:hypothetical protein [Actinomycetota bacterium]
MPLVEAPDKAVAGEKLQLSGSGFKASSKVEIVLDPDKPTVVRSVVTRADGSFRASVAVPARRHGKDRIQVVGTSASGKAAKLAKVVLIVANQGGTETDGSALAKPVLLTLAVVIPFATWLAFEVLSWRSRRTGTKSRRS